MTTQGQNPSSTVEAVAAAAVWGFLFSYLNFFIFGPSTQRSMCGFFRSFFFFWAPSSREPSPSCPPQFPPSFLPRSVAHKGGGGGGALRLTGGREGLDGWMDGWMSVGHRASPFLFSVKYAACARSFVHPRGAPQWPRLSERECARRRRVVFFRGFFFFLRFSFYNKNTERFATRESSVGRWKRAQSG